jgi:hypothetical protein
MADIFISYAREDRERAGRIAGVLESCGWSVWWDHKILTGQAFDEAIERELEAAKCVIVLWSRESIGSEWVKNEAAFAAERGVLVPALIDRVKLPLEFRRRQTADLVEWDGLAEYEGFKALYSGIAAKVKPVEGVAARPPEVIPVRKSRPGLLWKWAAVSAIAIVISMAAYWGLLSREDHTPPADNLADRVAGIYHGDVVSDARGSSRSDVTLTITKLSPRKVRVESDYKRLGTIEIDLTRVGKTIQSAGGRSLLLLDMEQNPPRLSFNPDGDVAYVGSREAETEKNSN